MSTKTIVIGSKENKPRKLKPLTFKGVLDVDYRDDNKPRIFVSNSVGPQPQDFNYIELISKNYIEGVDVMFAYNNPDPEKRGEGLILFGKWNDGVVE